MANFNRAVYETIKNTAGVPTPFNYGTTKGKARPFYTMLPIAADDEQPVALCETQGGQGIVRYQFSVAAGANAGKAEELLIKLKELVADIEGEISYTDSEGTHTYDIWNNVTGGVRTIGGADLNTWDAIFETELWWKKTS